MVLIKMRSTYQNETKIKVDSETFKRFVEEGLKLDRYYKDVIGAADKVLAETGKLDKSRTQKSGPPARIVNRSQTIDQTISSLPETSGVGRLSMRYPPTKGSRIMSTPMNNTTK